MKYELSVFKKYRGVEIDLGFIVCDKLKNRLMAFIKNCGINKASMLTLLGQLYTETLVQVYNCTLRF